MIGSSAAGTRRLISGERAAAVVVKRRDDGVGPSGHQRRLAPIAGGDFKVFLTRCDVPLYLLGSVPQLRAAASNTVDLS